MVRSTDNNVSLAKEFLRRRIRERLKSIPTTRYLQATEQLRDLVMRHPLYRQCQAVLLYKAMKNELDVQDICADALNKGKRVFFPWIDPKIKKDSNLSTMDFSEWKEHSVWKRSSGGFYQPNALWKWTGNLDTLAIVPGLAFDVEKNRLGRGQGYYDRFWMSSAWQSGKDFKRTRYKIGVCLREQCVLKIPVDAWDVALDEVLIV